VHDVFYVQKVLLDNIGVINDRFCGISSVQMLVNTREIVAACRRGKSYLKAQYNSLGVDFDAVEQTERSARPEDHAYNLIHLAYEQRRLNPPATDSDSDSTTSTSVSEGRDEE
jgi:hypothetical protein